MELYSVTDQCDSYIIRHVTRKADVSVHRHREAASCTRHVFKAFPSRPHICALRARKCTISILQRDVRKPASEPTAAIWRPTVGYARGEPYVPFFTLKRLGKTESCATCDSLLLGLSLPRFPRLRTATHGLPMSSRAGRQVYRARRARTWERNATLYPWGDRLFTGRKASEQVCKVTNVCAFLTSPCDQPL